MKSLQLIKYLAGMCLVLALACGCIAHSTPAVGKPDVSLRKAFPNMPFESIEQTDINGLYEVVSGQNLVYYYPEKGYLFFGEILTSAGKNLTGERKGELAAKLVKNLPLDKAVKSGNGKTEVIEFTDPDCPYCRKAYDFFKTRTDVTIYTFFSPFAHPGAITKVYYMLNADDRAKAYREIFEGKGAEHPAAGYSDSIKKLAQEHLDLARSVGVSGTPTFFINGKQVVGADFQKLETLLDDASQTGDKTDPAVK
jgi:thiol:disulfide interchange protein DsbC